MSLTITLSVPVLAGIIYLVTSLMASAAFCFEEKGFVNPRYDMAILTGFGWPVLFIQVAILAPVFDIYIGDIIRDLRER